MKSSRVIDLDKARPGSAGERTARWILRSQAPTQTSDAALEEWLAADEAHVDAYADGMFMWSDLGHVAVAKASAKPRGQDRWKAVAAMATLAAAFVAAVICFNLVEFAPSYATRIGEQRVVRLDDGSKMVLNTNSELKTRFEDKLRRIDLVHGEVLFDVASDKTRPFVVQTAGGSVKAVGTSFIVRSDTNGFEVILLSGIVDIEQKAGDNILLKPGERLRRNAAAPVLDRPQIEKVTAWRNGEIILDETPLPDAIGEVNRYAKNRIVLNSANAGGRKLSGVVRIDETDIFVESIAKLYDLKIERGLGSVTLSGEIAPDKETAN